MKSNDLSLLLSFPAWNTPTPLVAIKVSFAFPDQPFLRESGLICLASSASHGSNGLILQGLAARVGSLVRSNQQRDMTGPRTHPMHGIRWFGGTWALIKN